jgi:hypothetical protein
MPTKLIYHGLQDLRDNASPFDEVIVQMVRDEDVLIASPYIGLRYLKRIIGLSKSWRVLTDVEEWLASHESTSHQKVKEIKDFIVDNKNNIRHYKGLHAKAIVAGDSALAGSANFTESGITRRFEVAVLFEKEPEVDELKNLFENLWRKCGPVDVDELEDHIASMPMQSIEDTKEKPQAITSQAPNIRSKLVHLEEHSSEFPLAPYGEESHHLLVDRISLFPSREWMDTYFDLMREIIEVAGLSNDDPRIVTSIPKSYEGLLSVMVNRRYVLRAWSQAPSIGPSAAIIYGPGFETLPELESRVAKHERFNPLGGESGSEAPFFLEFGDVNEVRSLGEFKQGWLDAVLVEVERAKSSTHRKYHQPLVYRAAVDLGYRDAVLSDAFQ